MDKNKECYIVKDLAPAYMDDMVSIQSKDFIDKHLVDCKDCKEYYNNMNSNIFDEIDKEQINDSVEFNHLKKIRNHINFLKIGITIIILMIIFFIVGIIIKYNYTNNVIEMSYNKIEELQNLDNYILIQKTTYKDLEEKTTFEDNTSYYYKDGKYKIVSAGNIINEDNSINKLETSITYLEDYSFNKVCVYEDLKQIDYYKQDFIEIEKGKVFEMFSEIINYKKTYTKFNKLGLSIKEKKMNGIKCYVIRTDTDNSYKEIWIDKDTLITIKVIEEAYNKFYREVDYNLLENNVTEDDVDNSILNADRYKDYTVNTIDNAIQEKSIVSY
ncbi:MAG: zf-HC2 domain-containing protein [Clostridia bacterium]|nr:zf-HC2 domain-containing protein [Clostridia bacterium]